MDSWGKSKYVNLHRTFKHSSQPVLPSTTPPIFLQTKTPRLLGERGRQCRRVCRRERTTEKLGGRREENISASAEEKNGVCWSCERGEMAFSFHFTGHPFLAQPSSFTSHLLLHPPIHTHAQSILILCPITTQHVSVSQS